MNWLSDKINPAGPADLGSQAQPRISVILKLLVVLVVLATLYWAIWHFPRPRKSAIALSLLIPAYCVYARLVSPNPFDRDAILDAEPDGPGIWEMRFKAHCFPGRFVAQTLIDTAVLVRHAGTSSASRTREPSAVSSRPPER